MPEGERNCCRPKSSHLKHCSFWKLQILGDNSRQFMPTADGHPVDKTGCSTYFCSFVRIS